MGSRYAAYLVRLGNADGVHTMIVHAEDADRAVIWGRYHAGRDAERLVNESKRGRTLNAQETAFVAWADKECEPVKVLALREWSARFSDELPIFAPTGLAAWSLAKNKTVPGRVSIQEVSPAHLKMLCPMCGATYSGDAGDYWYHDDTHVFTCDCDERAPVCLFIAPNGEVVSDTGLMAELRAWHRDNSI